MLLAIRLSRGQDDMESPGPGFWWGVGGCCVVSPSPPHLGMIFCKSKGMSWQLLSGFPLDADCGPLLLWLPCWPLPSCSAACLATSLNARVRRNAITVTRTSVLFEMCRCSKLLHVLTHLILAPNLTIICFDFHFKEEEVRHREVVR